jgi:hypothetical protein
MNMLTEYFQEQFMIERIKRAINSMPWSRTQIKKIPQNLRSLTLATRSLGAVSR